MIHLINILCVSLILLYSFTRITLSCGNKKLNLKAKAVNVGVRFGHALIASACVLVLLSASPMAAGTPMHYTNPPWQEVIINIGLAVACLPSLCRMLRCMTVEDEAAL